MQVIWCKNIKKMGSIKKENLSKLCKNILNCKKQNK